MNKKNVLLYVFDGFADWEASYATVGIAKSLTHRIKTMALDKSPVCSMGGINIFPDTDFIPETDLPDIDSSTTSMLILPGGDSWLSNQNPDLYLLVTHCIQQNIPVAAICGATVFLANNGLLNAVHHTSNDLEWLKAVSSHYNGESFYQCQPYVKDKGIITASGINPVEFAESIFETLQIADQPAVKIWFQYFQNKTVIC